MTGYIGSTSSDVLSLSQTAIDQYNYNFTVPYSDTFYLVLQPQQGSSKGDYDAVISFSYYEYDPNCAQYTYWNGTDCDPDYNEFCQQYLEGAIQEHNPNSNPNITVTISYDGSKCLVDIQEQAARQFIEYIGTNETIEEIITETVYIQKNTTNVVKVKINEGKQFKRGER